MPDVTVTFIVAAVILFIGFLGELLFRRTGLPDILFLILFGIILGPVLNLFSKETLIPVTPYLVTLSLMMILFYGGMEMNLYKVFTQSGRAVLLGSTYFVFVTVGIAIFARFIFNMDWIQALMFGPMIAGTSSVVIIPLSQKLRLREETSLTISLESTITDVLNIVFFFALLELFTRGNLSFIETAQDLAARFGVGVLLGFITGVVWLWILYRIRGEQYTYISTLAVLMLTYVGTELLGGSGVLSALVLGLVIGNDARVSSFLGMKIDIFQFTKLKEFLMRFHSELAFLIRTFFFVFLGLLYDLSFTTLTFGLLFGLVFISINIFLRYLAVNLSVIRSPMTVDKVAMTLLCGQGLAHATLSVIPLQLGLPYAEIYVTIVITVIVLTNIITSAASIMISRKQRGLSAQALPPAM
ncbi:MAG: cation:proton antiporter [archaeon]|nr:cation:proton antiporter [archaeon]MCP8321179.1 cation:proton antiporter [archaeon]